MCSPILRIPRGNRLRSRADGPDRPRAGRAAGLRARSVGYAAPEPRHPAHRRGRQRLRVDHRPRPRLSGDPALLRLSASAHGAARRADHRLGATCSARSPAAVAGASACSAARRPRRSRASMARTQVEVVRLHRCDRAMLSRANGQLDATLQDLPAARFYRGQYPDARPGRPARGSRLLRHLRPQGRREALRDALDRAIEALIAAGACGGFTSGMRSGPTPSNELAHWTPDQLPTASVQESTRGWPLVAKYGRALLAAAADDGVPVRDLDAAGDGDRSVRRARPALRAAAACAGADGLRRVAARHAADAPALRAVLCLQAARPGGGIGGLAINYSAYEAEIYRAGLQAIPAGQMEAALALGMSRGWPCGG